MTSNGAAAAAQGSAAAAAPAATELLELAAQRLLAGEACKATPSSNYDYVKVKIRLGSQLEHYYILSRFLLSRVLTVITLPQHKAVRIALDVKKHLVDQERLDITQEELEEVLFDILRKKGYGDEYVQRYQMVTRFFQQKRPLIVLIAGSACTGKSTLAQQLASRLNMPNVLQTDVLYELLRASGVGDLPAEPLWRRSLPPGGSLLDEFQRECATIRRALDGDLCKCIRDGKSIIIEGLHLDPGLFLREFGDPRGDPVMVPAGSLELSSSPSASAEALPAVAEAAAGACTAASVPPAAGAAAAAGDAGAPAAAVAEQFDSMRLRPGAAQTMAAATPQQPPQPQQDQQQDQQQPQQQQVATTGVRRTASFGDAVPSLSYSGWNRQLSPWKDAASSKVLHRPRSARVGDPTLDRGQAVFMLRSVSSSASEGSLEGREGADLVQPVPSPRLAACISLPTVMEDGPGPLALPPGWHAGEEGGAQLPPVAEEAAPASGRSSSCDQQPEAAQACAATAAVAAAAAGCSAAAALGIAPWQQEPAAAPLPAATPSSVAAADAAAAAAAGSGPVFVPICLTVPDEEYELMLQDWLARQQAAGEAAGEPVSQGESARRLRQLQEHLRRYGASGVPVVEVSLTDMGQALDRLHAYVLQCIALALGESPAP